MCHFSGGLILVSYLGCTRSDKNIVLSYCSINGVARVFRFVICLVLCWVVLSSKEIAMGKILSQVYLAIYF